MQKRTFLANFAILFSSLGFIGYLFIIMASFFSCCAGLSSVIYNKIVLIILLVAVVTFGLSMVNNCCRRQEIDKA